MAPGNRSKNAEYQAAFRARNKTATLAYQAAYRAKQRGVKEAAAAAQPQAQPQAQAPPELRLEPGVETGPAPNALPVPNFLKKVDNVIKKKKVKKTQEQLDEDKIAKREYAAAHYQANKNRINAKRAQARAKKPGVHIMQNTAAKYDIRDVANPDMPVDPTEKPPLTLPGSKIRTPEYAKHVDVGEIAAPVEHEENGQYPPLSYNGIAYWFGHTKNLTKNSDGNVKEFRQVLKIASDNKLTINDIEALADVTPLLKTPDLKNKIT